MSFSEKIIGPRKELVKFPGRTLTRLKNKALIIKQPYFMSSWMLIFYNTNDV